LSNGTNPEKVDEYLGDCFDGMKCLDFIKGPGIPYPSKRAKGMYSKENEYVPFTHPNGGEFTMAGAVENYLCDLERCMQINLRDQLEIAKQTADNWEISDRKRHEWLEDYCA
jgi:dynein heavy chain